MTTNVPPPEVPARATGRLLFYAVVVIIVFQGFSVIDTDIPQVWRAMTGSPFVGDPTRLYLVEGLLPNVVGILLLHLHLGDKPTLFVWWLLGLITLIGSIASAVRSGSLSPTSLLIVLTFTRLVDTLSMWVGRSDPYLLAFLFLSIDDRKIVSRVAIGLAALCHPSVAFLAAAGSFSAGVSLGTRSDAIPVVIAGLVAALDISLAHWLVPNIVDRSGFLVSQFHTVVRSGIECGLVTFVSAFLFPFLCINAFRGEQGPARPSRYTYVGVWLVASAVIACLLSLDHTRVACLLTLTPLLTLLKITRPNRTAGELMMNRTFLVLATARIVIPHVAGDGFFLFNWGIVFRALGLAP